MSKLGVLNPIIDFQQDEWTPRPGHFDVCIIGSGMGSLCAAALLVHEGYNVAVLEQNYLPGGCSSSYYRKGAIFESGATTLVGLDAGMPLNVVMDICGIRLNAEKLDLPMQIVSSSGEIINRYPEINAWIHEAERVFGKKGQRAFWEHVHAISQWVWQVSSRQLNVPFNNLSDIWKSLKRASISDITKAPYAFISTKTLLKKYGLHTNPDFVQFVNEQLMITAQNTMEEVNALFGATALSYTLLGNYYIPGGMIGLPKTFCTYITSNGGHVALKTSVNQLEQLGEGWQIQSDKGLWTCDNVISGIPLNNLKNLGKEILPKSIQKKILPKAELCSAFQMGIMFQEKRAYDSIHIQIHCKELKPITGASSFFLSIHPSTDTSRSPEGIITGSVSTHAHLKLNSPDYKKASELILEKLHETGFIQKEWITYTHVANPETWEVWTKRAFGFVGGYPQLMRIKPWQMPGSKIKKGFYTCGDTVYPGQGIPGAALTGLLAAHKLLEDRKGRGLSYS